MESKLFHYPGENQYLTDDLSMVTIESEKTDLPQEYKNGRNDARLFVKPDFTFNLPKAHYTLLFRADAYFLQSNPEITAYINILPDAAMLALSSELYDANVASLSYSIKCDSSGLILEAKGISKTCPMLLKRLVRFFKEIDTIEDKYFTMAKNKKIKDIKSRLLDSKAVATEARLLYLQQGKSDALSVLKILESDRCSLEGMKKVVMHIFGNSFVEILIQGNINKKHAEQIFEDTMESIRTNPPKQMLHQGIQTRKVLKNEVIALKSFNTRSKDNHHVTKYYQIGPMSAEEQNMIDLFMDIISESTFNELRTKRQLGYMASSSIKNTHGIVGWTIDVKSAVKNHKMSHVLSCIDEYTDKYIPEFLKNLSDEEFDTFRESSISGKSAKDNALKEEVERNFGEIECEDFMFDRLQKEVKWLEELEKPVFMKFINKTLKKAKVLYVQVEGNEEGEEVNMEEFNFLERSTLTASDLKNNGECFPVSHNL